MIDQKDERMRKLYRIFRRMNNLYFFLFDRICTLFIDIHVPHSSVSDVSGYFAWHDPGKDEVVHPVGAARDKKRFFTQFF
jgi:hypothetical protein